MTYADSSSSGATTDVARALGVADYRRRVATIYSGVRDRGVGRDSWEWWRSERTELLLSHTQSPLIDDGSRRETAMRYFDYDPSWSVIGTVEPVSTAPNTPRVGDGRSTFDLIGLVGFERAGTQYQLELFWLAAYGGGLLLPFRDDTNGITTYGAGRYLLDGPKSADLGCRGQSELVLDFNFSYHPSCVWDPKWPCPLAPPSNQLQTEVEAGERKPDLAAPEAHGGRCERCGSWVADGAAHDCC